MLRRAEAAEVAVFVPKRRKRKTYSQVTEAVNTVVAKGLVKSRSEGLYN